MANYTSGVSRDVIEQIKRRQRELTAAAADQTNALDPQRRSAALTAARLWLERPHGGRALAEAAARMGTRLDADAVQTFARLDYELDEAERLRTEQDR